MFRFVIAAVLLGSAAPAIAGDVNGEWLNADGNAKVRFSNCGDAVCGALSWLKDPKGGSAKIGQQVFFDMKPSGDNTWKGSAFNPKNGKSYSGKMNLSGNTLVTAGCVLGGMICESESWTRAQ